MHEDDTRRRRAGLLMGLVGLAVLIAAACSAPRSTTGGAAPAANSSGRSTQDERVKSYRGQVPPDVFRQGTWVGSAGETSLAAERGRVVFLMFAFPR
jgi:hypothetical protein